MGVATKILRSSPRIDDLTAISVHGGVGDTAACAWARPASPNIAAAQMAQVPLCVDIVPPEGGQTYRQGWVSLRGEHVEL